MPMNGLSFTRALPIIRPNPLMKTIRGRSGLSVTAMAVTISETSFSSTVSEVRLTVRRFIASYQIKREVYGYSSDSYKGRIEVGRLISNKDVKFITARDNYSIASYAKSVSEEAIAIWNNYANDKLAVIESLRGVNGYELYPEDGTILYYADARKMADKARSLWLSLNFAGEYPCSAKPVRFKRKNYVPMFPPYDYINTIESVRKQFLKVFSKEFTDKTLNRAVADKELIEYKGNVYVVCKKRTGEASYNSCVDCVRDEGNGKFTVVIAVKMPPSGNMLYVNLPAEKNAAEEFVLSDYPYWEKSE